MSAICFLYCLAAALSFRRSLALLSLRRSLCLLSRRRLISVFTSRRLFDFLIIFSKPVLFAHCPFAARFHVCLPAARLAYCVAAARFRYCVSEGRLVFLLWLRSSLRLRIVFSPLGFLIVPVRLRIVLPPLGFLLCLLSRRLPSLLLFPRRRLVFLLCSEGRCVCASSLQTCRFFLLSV